MNSTTFRRATSALALTLAVGAAGTLPADASHGGGGVERRGSCSANSTWKLKAKANDGRIEVEAEVDSNRVGQTWTWRILHNGGVAARGKATTKAPSGSFTVHRFLVNAAGTDRIGLRAHNAATGESCSGGLKF